MVDDLVNFFGKNDWNFLIPRKFMIKLNDSYNEADNMKSDDDKKQEKIKESYEIGYPELHKSIKNNDLAYDYLIEYIKDNSTKEPNYSLLFEPNCGLETALHCLVIKENFEIIEKLKEELGENYTISIDYKKNILKKFL